MKVTEEMMRRFEAECAKRDAEKQYDVDLHTVQNSHKEAITMPSPDPEDKKSTGNSVDNTADETAEDTVNENAEDTVDDTMDGGILEELTIPGIVINIGEINIGEANLDIHNAEHYESSAWMRDGFCDDSCVPDDCISPDDGGYYDSDDGVADDDETGEGGGCSGDGTDDGGEDSKTSAVLSTEHHSVEVDQADMKDAISHILKIDRHTVEKVFLGMRLYLDALAEVLDEMGEPADGLGDHSADSHGTDSHRCKGCRFIRTTPKSRIAAHHV